MGESFVFVFYFGDGDNWNNFYIVGFLICYFGKLLDVLVYR